MGALLTMTESIEVARPPESVFGFTQDYRRRTEWDPTVLRAEVQPDADPPRVRVELAGGVSATFQYKLFRRPERTSMAIVDTRSWWMDGGGGSWEYEPIPGGTRWTATNSIVLRGGPVSWFVRPMLARRAASALRDAMVRARSIMEAEGATKL